MTPTIEDSCVESFLRSKAAVSNLLHEKYPGHPKVYYFTFALPADVADGNVYAMSLQTFKIDSGEVIDFSESRYDAHIANPQAVVEEALHDQMNRLLSELIESCGVEVVQTQPAETCSTFLVQGVGCRQLASWWEEWDQAN